jgi:hypothetical protein
VPWSTVTAVTNVEESQVSQDFRRSIFGHLSGGETMPPAFLSPLQHRLDDVAQIDIDVNVVIDHPGPSGDGHKGALWPHNIKTSIECRLGGEPSKARTVAERSN